MVVDALPADREAQQAVLHGLSGITLAPQQQLPVPPAAEAQQMVEG